MIAAVADLLEVFKPRELTAAEMTQVRYKSPPRLRLTFHDSSERCSLDLIRP